MFQIFVSFALTGVVFCVSSITFAQSSGPFVEAPSPHVTNGQSFYFVPPKLQQAAKQVEDARLLLRGFFLHNAGHRALTQKNARIDISNFYQPKIIQAATKLAQANRALYDIGKTLPYQSNAEGVPSRAVSTLLKTGESYMVQLQRLYVLFVSAAHHVVHNRRRFYGFNPEQLRFSASVGVKRFSDLNLKFYKPYALEILARVQFKAKHLSDDQVVLQISEQQKRLAERQILMFPRNRTEYNKYLKWQAMDEVLTSYWAYGRLHERKLNVGKCEYCYEDFFTFKPGTNGDLSRNLVVQENTYFNDYKTHYFPKMARLLTEARKGSLLNLDTAKTILWAMFDAHRPLQMALIAPATDYAKWRNSESVQNLEEEIRAGRITSLRDLDEQTRRQIEEITPDEDIEENIIVIEEEESELESNSVVSGSNSKPSTLSDAQVEEQLVREYIESHRPFIAEFIEQKAALIVSNENGEWAGSAENRRVGFYEEVVKSAALPGDELDTSKIVDRIVRMEVKTRKAAIVGQVEAFLARYLKPHQRYLVSGSLNGLLSYQVMRLSQQKKQAYSKILNLKAYRQKLLGYDVHATTRRNRSILSILKYGRDAAEAARFLAIYASPKANPGLGWLWRLEAPGQSKDAWRANFFQGAYREPKVKKPGMAVARYSGITPRDPDELSLFVLGKIAGAHYQELNQALENNVAFKQVVTSFFKEVKRAWAADPRIKAHLKNRMVTSSDQAGDVGYLNRRYSSNILWEKTRMAANYLTRFYVQGHTFDQWYERKYRPYIPSDHTRVRKVKPEEIQFGIAQSYYENYDATELYAFQNAQEEKEYRRLMRGKNATQISGAHKPNGRPLARRTDARFLRSVQQVTGMHHAAALPSVGNAKAYAVDERGGSVKLLKITGTNREQAKLNDLVFEFLRAVGVSIIPGKVSSSSKANFVRSWEDATIVSKIILKDAYKHAPILKNRLKQSYNVPVARLKWYDLFKANPGLFRWSWSKETYVYRPTIAEGLGRFYNPKTHSMDTFSAAALVRRQLSKDRIEKDLANKFQTFAAARYWDTNHHRDVAFQTMFKSIDGLRDGMLSPGVYPESTREVYKRYDSRTESLTVSAREKAIKKADAVLLKAVFGMMAAAAVVSIAVMPAGIAAWPAVMTFAAPLLAVPGWNAIALKQEYYNGHIPEQLKFRHSLFNIQTGQRSVTHYDSIRSQQKNLASLRQGLALEKSIFWVSTVFDAFQVFRFVRTGLSFSKLFFKISGKDISWARFALPRAKWDKVVQGAARLPKGGAVFRGLLDRPSWYRFKATMQAATGTLRLPAERVSRIRMLRKYLTNPKNLQKAAPAYYARSVAKRAKGNLSEYQILKKVVSDQIRREQARWNLSAARSAGIESATPSMAKWRWGDLGATIRRSQVFNLPVTLMRALGKGNGAKGFIARWGDEMKLVRGLKLQSMSKRFSRLKQMNEWLEQVARTNPRLLEEPGLARQFFTQFGDALDLKVLGRHATFNGLRKAIKRIGSHASLIQGKMGLQAMYARHMRTYYEGLSEEVIERESKKFGEFVLLSNEYDLAISGMVNSFKTLDSATMSAEIKPALLATIEGADLLGSYVYEMAAIQNWITLAVLKDENITEEATKELLDRIWRPIFDDLNKLRASVRKKVQLELKNARYNLGDQQFGEVLQRHNLDSIFKRFEVQGGLGTDGIGSNLDLQGRSDFLLYDDLIKRFGPENAN